MKARDVMVSPVMTLKPSNTVADAARLFLDNRISAAPVVDDQGKILGIVSEGDLMHRVEAGTQRRRSWWLTPFVGETTLATEYVKAHAKKVADIMTRNVTTVSPDTPLHEIAGLIEGKRIKRVPVVSNGQLVGIVSRANLVQALATAGKSLDVPITDATVREKLLGHLKTQPWAHLTLVNITVSGGVVDLWGFTRSDTEKKALRVAAEAMPGVRAVNDHLVIEKMIHAT